MKRIGMVLLIAIVSLQSKSQKDGFAERIIDLHAIAPFTWLKIRLSETPFSIKHSVLF
jgi:hypothetical protein